MTIINKNCKIGHKCQLVLRGKWVELTSWALGHCRVTTTIYNGCASCYVKSLIT